MTIQRRTAPPQQPPVASTPQRQAPPQNPLKLWEQALLINENDLDMDLVRQPDVFYRVSRAAALLQSRKDAASQNVKEIEAQAEAQIREQAELREEKVTEKSVASQVVLHPDVRQARAELHTISQQLGEMAALRDAFKERSYALRGLVDLYIANYYSDASAGSSQRRSMEASAAVTRRNREARSDSDA